MATYLEVLDADRDPGGINCECLFVEGWLMLRLLE